MVGDGPNGLISPGDRRGPTLTLLSAGRYLGQQYEPRVVRGIEVQPCRRLTLRGRESRTMAS